MSEPCELSVPIYPVRYTVKERKPGDAAYAYSEADLESGYEELKHSQYTTRLLREGFVYLYDANKGENKGLRLWKVNKEGSFTELNAKIATLENLDKLYKTGSTVSFIKASAKSTETYIGYTDTLWTANIYAKIVRDTDNIRQNTMTQINIKKWVDTQPDKNTFPAAKAGKLVEEYKDSNWKTNLQCSLWETEPMFESCETLDLVMATQPKCKAQIIAALYDNIGLVEDQTMLLHHYRSFYTAYTAKHHRKKLVADLIDQIYTQNYATEKEISGGEAAVKQSIQTDITLKKEYYDKQMHYTSSDYNPNPQIGI